MKFYFFLKHLVKTKLTGNQSILLLSSIHSKRSFDLKIEEMNIFLESITGKDKKYHLDIVFSRIQDEMDLRLFIFSLKLYMIKDLLLAEANLKSEIELDNLSQLDPLSLKYDDKTLNTPYSTRVSGALLSLCFFHKLENKETSLLSQDSKEYFDRLSDEANSLKKIGIEPNQIFMLMFSESINQSIISKSGTNYEDRIFDTLINIGVPSDKITKIHDAADKSTEYDFFFELDGRSYGIGAKRTLRERYKQFIKTSISSDIDVMIEITLGLDLNESKAKTILNHNTKIFVADEIYQSKSFLQEMVGVFSVKDLNLDTLKNL
ncbi:hypothetical protein IB680_09275 [Francisella philomiragia]|nr:hypothetical protein [Francisella philomiragia]